MLIFEDRIEGIYLKNGVASDSTEIPEFELDGSYLTSRRIRAPLGSMSSASPEIYIRERDSCWCLKSR